MYVIIKESANATLFMSLQKVRRHEDAVRGFPRNPSPMKKRPDCDTSKSVTAADLRSSIRKSCGETRTNKKSHLHCRRISSCTENHQKSYPWDHGFRAIGLETASFNAPSQKFEFSFGSELYDVGHGFCSVRCRDSWYTWMLGKWLGVFMRWASPTFATSTTAWFEVYICMCIYVCVCFCVQIGRLKERLT